QDPNLATTVQPPSAFAGNNNPFGNLTRPDTTQPLNLEGDELIYDNAGQKVTARGNVEILFNNYTLRADEIVYDQRAGTLTAFGNVTLTEPGGIVTRGERIVLTDDFRDGFVDSLRVVGTDQTTITARRAIRRDGNVTIFEDGKFTPCRTDGGSPPLWCIAASRVVQDQTNQTITYTNPEFRVLGQTVFWLPYFQHADPSVKRKTGFLQPGISHSTNLGYSIETPYYFALDPSYDFTFFPRYYSKQGLLLQGQWRQKVAFGDVRGTYDVKIAAIDQNGGDLPGNLSDAERDDLDGWRGTLETRGNFSLSSWWRFGWDVTIESDESFRRFYKFDSVLQTDRVNSAFLIGQSERNYFSMIAYHFGGLQFQETPTAESQVHPVIDWNYIVGQPVFGGELSIDVNAISLTRSLETGTVDTTSSHQRASVDVNWRRKLTDRIGITYTPFANLRGDVFALTDTLNAVTLEEDNITEARGTAAAGVLAEYPWIARSRSASHVIAPLGQVIARSTLGDSQTEIPNEDSRSLVFDDTNLFEVDKFSGYDRTESGSRANVGLQYTFHADNGGYARLLAGQSFQLDSTNPFRRAGDTNTTDESTFSEFSGLETKRSDYVIGAYLSPSSVFQVVAQGRFNETDLSLQQADVFARANYGPAFGILSYAFTEQAVANLGRAATDADFVDDDQQEIVASLGFRLTQNWTISGGVRYDLDTSTMLQDSIAIQYADDCFVLSVTYTESRIEDENGVDDDQTIMVRFDLKHLGQFQTSTSVLPFTQGDDGN
ncbi:MAG: LPS-assembly protein LptD, partial [Pseudomonadota bacterium]